LEQFEPESFVDGLLGIGVAGGGSSKEGQALASRLTQMRKERTDRAKAASTSTKSTTASPMMSPMGGMDGPAGQMTLQGLEDIGSMENMMEEDMGEMQLITAGGAGTGGGKKSSGKSKNKKKKKRKNKK